MRKRLQPLADEVFEYMDHFNDRIMNAVGRHQERISILNTIHERYSLFVQATSYDAMMNEVVSFPLAGVDPGEYEGPNRKIIFANARAYFDAMLPAAGRAVAAYEGFIENYTSR